MKKEPDKINNQHDKCEWFSKIVEKLSKKIYIPSTNNGDNMIKITINKHYINENYQYANNNIICAPIKIQDINKKIQTIKNQLDAKIKKINNNKKMSKKQKEIAIKISDTKMNNKLNVVDSIIKTRKYKLQLNDNQKIIINKWYDECLRLYNYCVDKYNTRPFNLDYMTTKIQIFNEIYGNNKKPCPYDILTDEVRIFCSNVKSAISNLKNGHIKHFTMSHKDTNKGQSIIMPKKSISCNGFFTSFIGSIKNFNKINTSTIKSDCRLIFDKCYNKYYLLVPECYEKHNIIHKEDIVSLDPGEKTFMAYFGSNSYGKIGDDIRIPILKIEQKIRKYQRILNKNKNKQGKKIKNKKTFKLKIKKLYRKIQNIVKELHNQTALFLCKNYKRIMIPKFETQKMVTDKKEIYKKIKENVQKIKDGNNVKEELKSYTKKRRLNGRVKFVLNRLSHYSFRQHLSHKCEEYGCELKVVTEEYTSKCCGKCGFLSDSYLNRIKTCSNCGMRINRDINGARNILLKNHNVFKVKVN